MIQRAERLRMRDHILEVLLFYIANSPINREVILRGGNALHFIYSSPRYSSDLDFAAPNFREIYLLINEVLSNISDTHKFNSDGLLIIDSKIREDLIRKKYAYSLKQGVPFGRIEVLDDKVFSFAQTKGKFHPLLVAVPSEIYADKVYATLNRVRKRDSFKGTDLFDLEYIVDNLNGEASLEEIERKARHYRFVGYDRKTVDKVLMMIINPELQKHYVRGLRRTMMPDFYSEQKFDKEYFERCTRHFERLRNI